MEEKIKMALNLILENIIASGILDFEDYMESDIVRNQIKWACWLIQEDK